MTRSWKDVKAEKARRDQANGRDVAEAHSEAQARTQEHILGSRGLTPRTEV